MVLGLKIGLAMALVRKEAVASTLAVKVLECMMKIFVRKMSEFEKKNDEMRCANEWLGYRSTKKTGRKQMLANAMVRTVKGSKRR